jgi:hypothetical protein
VRFRLGDPLKAVCIALIAGAYVIRLALVDRHAFNPDEFQHLHGAWSIATGLLPYRDYFEHHTPWLHFFLAAFVGLFDVATSARAAEAFIFFSRGWMCFFSALALALTFRLGQLSGGDATAWVATAILSLTTMFLDKTLEIRPDVPAVAFLLGSWLALLGGLRGAPGDRRTRALFAASGWLLGTAVLCTQKVLFALPATALLLLAHVAVGRSSHSARDRLRDVVVHAAAAAGSIAIVLASFAARNAGSAFIESNLIVNARWKAHVGPGPILNQLWTDNPLMVALGVVAWAGMCARLLRHGRAAMDSNAFWVAQAAGLALGALVIPVAYAQYFVMLLPVLALLAARALLWTSEAVRDVAKRGAAVATITAITLLAAIAAKPIWSMAALLDPPHSKVRDDLATIAHVVETTPPQETVLDGFSGFGVFRPHAFRYFFLHEEVRALLAGRELDKLLGALRDGTVSPSLVALDRDLLALPADIVAFLKANYEATAVPPLWRRRVLWLDDDARGGRVDLGQGQTDVLAGHGWYRPERAGDRTFRQGRGRHSSVRLPLRSASACHAVTIRARLQYAAAEPRIAVAMNGVPLGVLALAPGWQDYDLALPPGVARDGMNMLQLSYDPVPRTVDPAFEGRNALAAVDEIVVRCERRP